MVSWTSVVTLGAVLVSTAAGVQAQSIYSCTDAKGRRITSDRPIAECLDRDHRELSTTGTVKRIVKPVMTAEEARLQEERDKATAEDFARQAEEKRRDRALLTRYPNKAAHDKERADALSQVDEVMKAANKRSAELVDQRKLINVEMEFYKKDPAKAPPSLKRRIDENEHSQSVQQRFIADQEQEKARVRQRFDEEQVKLRELWMLVSPASTGASTVVSPAKPAKK